MAKIKKQLKTVDKWKKKKWFTILAPKVFQERPLGQTCASNPAQLKGRTTSVNLMTLTGNIKKQTTDVLFEIVDSQGEKALTQIKKIELMPAYIKRKVRRNKDRIDASFVCVTKDNKYLRLKPIIITVSKSSRAIQSKLKQKMMEYTIKTVKNQTYDDLINDLINYKFQRTARNLLSPIFPIIDADLRSIVLLKEDTRKLFIPKVEEKTHEAKPAEAVEEAEKPAEEQPKKEQASPDKKKEEAPVENLTEASAE